MTTIDSPWQDATIIAFDTETSGKYPLESELCEIAAVKWRGGKVIDTYQTLVKPTRTMSDEVIAIHHITNEMVVEAPSIAEVIGDFHKFIEDAILVAHHAPFDLGFLTIEFDKQGLPLPTDPVLCSSLISRRALPQSPNHRLQTLVKYLGIEAGQAHRALDDAKACLDVALKSFSVAKDCKTISDLIRYQKRELDWKYFSIATLKTDAKYEALVDAVLERTDVEIVYSGGSRPGQARRLTPIGIVLSPGQDFLVAQDDKAPHPKRFYLNKITSSNRL